MENIKNHPAPDQLDSFDKYPPYYGQDLELAYTPQRSVFTLWAPTASKTRLNIYSSGEGGNPEEQLEMEPSDDGTWRIAVERDLNGSFYTFQIEKEGKWLAETPGIWAKAVGINGDRAAVIDWNQTNPEGWESDRAPELKMYSDIILYELHHRDFSIAPDSGIRNQGQISGPDRNRHKNPRRRGIRSGSPQGTGRNAYTHPPLLRLCDGGRDKAGGQDLQLGIRPEELQRSGRQLLHRPGQPRDAHPRV